MNVTDAARTIGLVAINGEVSGTIDQARVLDTLAELADHDPASADLFGAVADRVQRARSAGLEVHDISRTPVTPTAAATQLRYRSEMAELFTDLAIDVGLRDHQKLVSAV